MTKNSKLLENYEIQKVIKIFKSVWSRILIIHFMILIENLNFFSNNLSDGIANPGFLKEHKRKIFEM